MAGAVDTHLLDADQILKATNCPSLRSPSPSLCSLCRHRKILYGKRCRSLILTATVIAMAAERVVTAAVRTVAFDLCMVGGCVVPYGLQNPSRFE